VRPSCSTIARQSSDATGVDVVVDVAAVLVVAVDGGEVDGEVVGELVVDDASVVSGDVVAVDVDGAVVCSASSPPPLHAARASALAATMAVIPARVMDLLSRFPDGANVDDEGLAASEDAQQPDVDGGGEFDDDLIRARRDVHTGHAVEALRGKVSPGERFGSRWIKLTCTGRAEQVFVERVGPCLGCLVGVARQVPSGGEPAPEVEGDGADEQHEEDHPERPYRDRSAVVAKPAGGRHGASWFAPMLP
jgi:hypothetical protein